jgi:hypothetical protein
MSRSNKARPSQPARQTGPLPPVEIIELQSNSKRPSAPAVTLTPADQVEIIEAPRLPRKQLILSLRPNAGCDTAAVLLSTARFLSAVLTADRKLRLAVDPEQSRVEAGVVTLAFTTVSSGVEAAERLGKLSAAVREAAASFEGATLTRVELVERTEAGR